MHFPTKAELEMAGAVIGIAGSSLTAFKTSIGYIRDHSLERRRVKTLEGVDTCLKRLRRVRAERNASPSLQLSDEYDKQVAEELESLIAMLQGIRAEKLRLERRKTEDPEGARKWLLLYKPEGVDGWISQTLFYGIVLFIFLMVVAKLVVTLVSHDWINLLFIAITLPYLMFAYYFWSLSLRLKRTGNAQRRGELGKLNSDLGWFRKVFPLFGGGSWGSAVGHLFYYVFLFDGFFGWFVMRSDFPSSKATRPDWAALIFMCGFFLLMAEIVRADLLLRRGLRVASFQSRAKGS
jgi:hypothetical protein